MNERITLIRKETNMTQDEFAERMSISKNYVSLIENGKKNPSDRLVADICREFGINEDWLRTGAGEMKSSSDDILTKYVEEIVHGNDDFIKDLVFSYMDLDRDSKDALMELAKRMAKRINEREP